MAEMQASDLRTRRSGFAPPATSSGFDSPNPHASSGWGGHHDAGASGSWSSNSSFSSTSGQDSGGWASSASSSASTASLGSGGGRIASELRLPFVLLVVTAFCLHADQNLAAPNLSAIAEDFGMTPMQKDSRLGGMTQFGFFLIGGAVSLVVGPATDQVDRVNLLVAVIFAGAVPSLLMSLLVPSSKVGFFYFFLARVCAGIAVGGSFPVLFSLASDIFPPSQRAFVLSCISAATNIGGAVGGIMAGIIGSRFGWRVPFRIVAVPSLICAVAVRLLLTDPRTAKKQQKAREEASAIELNPAFSAWTGGADATPSGYVRMEELDFTKFKRVLHVRTNMLIFAQALPGCIPLACIVTFLSDYMSVEQGMQVQASTAVNAVVAVSSVVFAVGGGMLGQKIYAQRKDQLPVLIGTAICFSALPFMALVNAPRSAVTTELGRPTVLALFLALLGGCANIAGPNLRIILMNVNDTEVRGTVFSAFTLFEGFGKGVGPSVIVAMTAVLGRRAAYTVAFSFWWLSGVSEVEENLSREEGRQVIFNFRAATTSSSADKDRPERSAAFARQEGEWRAEDGWRLDLL